MAWGHGASVSPHSLWVLGDGTENREQGTVNSIKRNGLGRGKGPTYAVDDGAWTATTKVSLMSAGPTWPFKVATPAPSIPRPRADRTGQVESQTPILIGLFDHTGNMLLKQLITLTGMSLHSRPLFVENRAASLNLPFWGQPTTYISHFVFFWLYT